MPIVWHVIQLYAAQGFERFLLATGYKGELIERFVAGAARGPAGVEVECVDTGLETPDGRAASSCSSRCSPDERDVLRDLRRRRSPTSTSRRCSPSTAATARWRR